MEYTEQERRALERPSYNYLYFIAMQYALNSPMTTHRAEQFAADYANTFDGIRREGICSPKAFVKVSATIDYHYHD